MSFGDDKIVRKSPQQIDKMRRSGQLVRQVLNHVKSLVAPGATTSGMPPIAEATTAVSHAIASRLMIPNGSYTDGQQNTAACE
jgi:methionine aminopeptidase